MLYDVGTTDGARRCVGDDHQHGVCPASQQEPAGQDTGPNPPSDHPGVLLGRGSQAQYHHDSHQYS